VLAGKATLAFTTLYCFVMADVVYHEAFWNIAIGFNPSNAMRFGNFALKVSLSVSCISDGFMPDYTISHFSHESRIGRMMSIPE
jgi:hypothetical protein